MNKALANHQPTSGQSSVSTILSEETRIPLNCDHCGLDSELSLASLKQLDEMTCPYCQHSRIFTKSELITTQQVLANLGYHFSL